MDVSKNIRTIREGKNLTQVDVALRLGTERSNYARLENRGENLTIKQISEIAAALKVSIYDIIGTPESLFQTEDQYSKIVGLEEKLKVTEEILKEKRKNIKFYKSFIEWTKEKFEAQFKMAALHYAKQLGLRDIEIVSVDDLNLDLYNFSEIELKSIGAAMLSYEAPDYFLNDFLAASGFITESWYISAYKSVSRKRKEKIAFAEVKNWVNGVFEFLEDE